jgi:predicted MFS family arabinose efflux permease
MTPETPSFKLSPNFLRLAWSNLAAQSAEQISLAAAPIVAVVAFGAGPGATGLLQTLQTLPFLLLSIPAGIAADRMPRARLMAGAEALRVAALIVILAMIAAGRLSFAALAVLGFLGACGTVAYGVAAPALVPALVPNALLPTANGRIEIARTSAFAAGPALGGLLVGWTGASAAFSLAAVLSATAVLLLYGLNEPNRRDIATSHLLRGLGDSVRFVARQRLLRPTFVAQISFNVAFFVLQAIYVPYAITDLGLSPSHVGMTLACYGLGLFAGALIAARVMARHALGHVIAVGPVSSFVASGLMVLTIWVPSPFLAGGAFFLMGAGPILWVVSTTTLRQTVTPDAFLGRVSAIFSLSYGARPVGAALGALIGGLFGAKACLVFAAAGFGLTVLFVTTSPLIRLIRAPTPA